MTIPAKTKYIVLSLLFIVASANFVRTANDILKSSKRLDDLNNEIRGLEATKNKLGQAIDYKKTNDYVEERARNDLNMVKPGEKVLVFVDKTDTKSPTYTPGNVLATSSQRQNSTTRKETNIHLWYRLFFDK